MKNKLQRLLLASTSILCISASAWAQEAEGTIGTIASTQENSASVNSSVDFNITIDVAVGGAFSLDGEDLDGWRSGGTGRGLVDLYSTGNILSSIDLSADNAWIHQFSTNTSTFGSSVYSSGSVEVVLTYFANNPTFAAGEANYDYKYVPIFFVPEVSGVYTIGQMSAPVDTLLFFFEGEFDPLDFSQNFIGGNDDYGSGYAGVGAGGLPPSESGYSQGQCGSSANLCPGINVELEAGKYYTMVLSHYSTSGYDNFSFPLSVYAYGAGSTTIVGSEEELEDVMGGDSADVISGARVGIVNNTASAVAKGLQARNTIEVDRVTAAAPSIPAILIAGSPSTLTVSASSSILNAQTNSGAVTASIDGSDPATPAHLEIGSTQPTNASAARIRGNSVQARAFGTEAMNTVSLADGSLGNAPSIAVGSAHTNSGAIQATVRDVGMRIAVADASASSFHLTGNSIVASATGNHVSSRIGRPAAR